MIQGYVGRTVPALANFLPSRAGLATVGYTLLDKNGDMLAARTVEGVAELAVNTGIYRVSLEFEERFEGFILWDTGQDASGEGSNRLRTLSEEISIIYPFDVDVERTPALKTILEAVQVMYEENVMKIPNGTIPTEFQIVRKRMQDPDWSNPYSDKTLYIVPNPARFGGPRP